MVSPSLSVLVPPSLRSWPRRRWIAAAVLTGPLAALYLSVGPSLTIWWAVPAALWCAVPAALLLASYLAVPEAGGWVDAGCSPCTAVSGVAVLGALVMRATAPAGLGIAVVAGLMVMFGLGQRLSAVTSCAAAR